MQPHAFAEINGESKKQFEKHFVSLRCDGSCDRVLLWRWFSSVCSILTASDVETYHFLLSRKYTSFVVKNFDSVSIRLCIKFQCNDKCISLPVDLDVSVPVVIGTQLWFMCKEFPSGFTIDHNIFRAYRDCEPRIIQCPFCSFPEYIPLGCFIVNGKLTRLPIFAFVDSKKLHVNRRSKLLCAYFKNKSLKVPQEIQLLQRIIAEWCDNFANYSFQIPTLTFLNLIKHAVDSMFDTIRQFDPLVFDDSIRVNCAHIELPISQIKAKLYTKSTELTSFLLSGNVTTAVSKSTRFKVTDIGGQSHESDVFNVQQRDMALMKTECETRRGYFRPSSRYLLTVPNHPGQLVSAILQIVKLISGQVLSTTHQCLHTSSLNYVCLDRSSDGKNSGSILEILIGVQIVHRFNCVSNDYIANEIIMSAKWIITTFPAIQREYCKCMEHYQLTHLETIDIHFLRNILNKSSNASCKCPSEGSIIIADSEMNIHEINIENLPRFDLVILATIYRTNEGKAILPLDVYFNRKLKRGLIRSFSNTLLDERLNLTPTTREWLLSEYPESWSNILSNSVNGNTLILGALAHSIPLPGHSATAKTISGLCGTRHACGLPVSIARTTQPTKSLCIPQTDLSRKNSTMLPTQLAFVIVTALGGNNVEDGIVVSKCARDRGFGMTESHYSSWFKATCLSDGIMILFPSEKFRFYCAFKIDDKCHTYIVNGESLSEIRSDNDVIDIPLSEWYKRRKISEGTSILDIVGISNVSSYATNLQMNVIESSCRVLFHDPFACGVRDGSVQIDRITVHLKSSSKKVAAETSGTSRKRKLIEKNITGHIAVVTIYFTEVKLLECGDKYSTIDGQKSTVVSVVSQEDLPFYSGTNENLPPQADVYCNISMEKRQTLGNLISANIRALKCVQPDTVDLNMLCGDQSIQSHSTQLALKLKINDNLFETLDPISKLIYNARKESLQKVRVFDGRTGVFMGLGDILVVPFLRYEQEGSKAAHYTGDSEDIARSIHGDYPLRGRGKLGGMKQSQSDTCNLIAAGSSSRQFKQLQYQGEPRHAIDKNSGRLPQSTIDFIKTLNILGYNITLD